MGLRNTQMEYGSVAKWLHWLTALCFLAAYVSVYYAHVFVPLESDQRPLFTRMHAMFGFSVGVFFLPRIIWMFMNPKPEVDPGPVWQHNASKVVHWALYFFMIAMPLSGWLGFGATSFPFLSLFDIPTFRGSALYAPIVEGWLGITFQQFEEPFDYFHKQIAGPWLVWVLIVVHTGAALYHHYVQKDNTLRKMLPSARRC